MESGPHPAPYGIADTVLTPADVKFAVMPQDALTGPQKTSLFISRVPLYGKIVGPDKLRSDDFSLLMHPQSGAAETGRTGKRILWTP